MGEYSSGNLLTMEVPSHLPWRTLQACLHFLDRLPVPIFRCDRQGVIGFCNAAARDLFGTDISGVNAGSLLFQEVSGTIRQYHELIEDLVKRYPQELGLVPLILQKPGGDKREIASRLSYDTDEDQITCVLLPGVHSLLNALARIAESAVHASHVDETLVAISSEARRLTQAVRSYVVYVEGGKLSCRALASLNPSESLPQAVSPADDSPIVNAVRTGHVVNYPDAAHSYIWSPFSSVSAQLIAPITSTEQAGHPIRQGVLVVEGDRQNQFGVDAETMLQTIASHGATAIVHVQLSLEVRSTYDEILEQLRSVPELTVIRRLIHDANNLVRDATSIAEKLQAELAESAFGKKRAGEMSTSLEGLKNTGDLLSELLRTFETAQTRPAKRREEPVDLIDLVRRIQPVLRSSAGVQIDILSIDKQTSYLAFGDKSKLLMIFYNLMTNAATAIRSSGKLGRIIVTVSDNPKQKWFRRIEISDTGPGMDKNVRMLIEGGKTISNTVGGFGIGLIAVRAVIQELRGSLEIESHVGGGTRFTVNLPGPERIQK